MNIHPKAKVAFAFLFLMVVACQCSGPSSVGPCLFGDPNCWDDNPNTVPGAPRIEVMPPGQPAPQIHPGGQPDVDQQNSGTNLNNARAAELLAQAQLLEAEARRLDTLAPAEAAHYYALIEKLRAEACDIRNDCGLFNYLEGEKQGESQGFMAGLASVVLAVAGFVVVLLFVMMLFRK